MNKERLILKNNVRKPAIKIFVLFIASISALLIFHFRDFKDYQTSLRAGTYLKIGSSDLTAGKWSVPVVHDWDNDGKKDLLIGHKKSDESGVHGYISFYRNTGSDEAPAFNGFTYVQKCETTCSPVDVTASL